MIGIMPTSTGGFQGCASSGKGLFARHFRGLAEVGMYRPSGMVLITRQPSGAISFIVHPSSEAGSIVCDNILLTRKGQ
jgi:hypothetical protein